VVDATARIRRLSPPPWDWSFEVDGTLALDRRELWDEPERPRRTRVAETARLKGREPFATVPAMPAQVRDRRVRATRRRELAVERRRRRIAVLIALTAIALPVVLLSAFGGSGAVAQVPPANAASVVPAGPPTPEIVARLGTLQLQLPVSQSQVTAIGYQGGSDGSRPLSPLGTQANEGLVKRVLHAIVGGSAAKPRWYQLPGGESSATSSLEVGARAGTDVYAPVDGTVVAISQVVLNGRQFGSRIDIQPQAAPSLVVSVSHVHADPALVVGSPVTAGGTKLGSVVDVARVEHEELAHYTNDAGNHVVVEVHASPALGLG
jgi:hypothetical protein